MIYMHLYNIQKFDIKMKVSIALFMQMNEVVMGLVNTCVSTPRMLMG
jgi:hypothetical protein